MFTIDHLWHYELHVFSETRDVKLSKRPPFDADSWHIMLNLYSASTCTESLGFSGSQCVFVCFVCVFYFIQGWFFHVGPRCFVFFFSVGDLVAEMFGKTPGKLPRWFVPKWLEPRLFAMDFMVFYLGDKWWNLMCHILDQQCMIDVWIAACVRGFLWHFMTRD